MKTRLELQAKLVDILGSSNVYFQPPESLKLSYPCIVYTYDGMHVRYSNDGKYMKFKQYTINVVDKDPDSEIPDKVSELPYCSMGNPYTADNLYHYPLTLYI